MPLPCFPHIVINWNPSHKPDCFKSQIWKLQRERDSMSFFLSLIILRASVNIFLCIPLSKLKRSKERCFNFLCKACHQCSVQAHLNQFSAYSFEYEGNIYYLSVGFCALSLTMQVAYKTDVHEECLEGKVQSIERLREANQQKASVHHQYKSWPESFMLLRQNNFSYKVSYFYFSLRLQLIHAIKPMRQ